MTPVDFNQEHRYLPPSVTNHPGFIDFDMTPYWIEILNRFDVRSSAREIAVRKGVQVAYTTLLESILFYFAAHIRTAPTMYATADKELSKARIETSVIPMFQQSGFNIFQAADSDSSRKTGKTQDMLQWEGGGYCVPFGAKNSG